MNLPILEIKGLSIERIKAFCAVVESGSVIGAAGGDPNRQSQMSRQIKELEDALGVRLFNRINRRLVPTDVGRELSMLAAGFFANIVDITEREQRKGFPITIAAGESVFSGFIIPRMESMRRALPNCRFLFRQCGTEDALRRVRSGEADLAVVRDSANLDGLQTAKLGPARYRLAIPRRLLPSGQKEGLTKLKRLPVGVLSGNGQLMRAFERVLEESGAEIDVVAESDTFSGLRDLIETGHAAAILPEWSARRLPNETTTVVNFPGLHKLDRNLVVVCHPSASLPRPIVAEAIPVLVQIWKP